MCFLSTFFYGISGPKFLENLSKAEVSWSNRITGGRAFSEISTDRVGASWRILRTALQFLLIGLEGFQFSHPL